MYSEKLVTTNEKTEQDLNEIERSIGLLKRDFEKFFSGAMKLPPLEFQNKLANKIKQYSTIGNLSSAQRFRYNSLSARYLSYAELWAKQLRYKEEGRTPPGGVAAANRKKPQAVSTEIVSQNDRLVKLYQDYVRSRTNTGESSENLSYENFRDVVFTQRQTILDKFGCKDVDFFVTIEQNRAKLKARLIK